MYDEMRMHHKRLNDAETQRLQDNLKAMQKAQTQTAVQQFA